MVDRVGDGGGGDEGDQGGAGQDDDGRLVVRLGPGGLW